MSSNLEQSPLAKKSAYESSYNPKLLFAIARAPKREELGLNSQILNFYGIDLWTHYELSWLNLQGKPIVAMAQISYPAFSNYIIESKSMKLYFNSFNNTKIKDYEQLIKIVSTDLSAAVEAQVEFKLMDLQQNIILAADNQAYCLDELEIECNQYTPHQDYLFCENDSVVVKEYLYSNLLKSNCLVTNQPDFGTIYISYQGIKINHQALLKYIISFRNHNEFHEQCVEKIFVEIKSKCNPSNLTVYARYTRRGGIEINPYRSSDKNFVIKSQRLIRQ